MDEYDSLFIVFDLGGGSVDEQRWVSLARLVPRHRGGVALFVCLLVAGFLVVGIASSISTTTVGHAVGRLVRYAGGVSGLLLLSVLLGLSGTSAATVPRDRSGRLLLVRQRSGARKEPSS